MTQAAPLLPAPQTASAAETSRVQAKLTLGPQGGPHEKEADRIAEAVLADRPRPLTGPLPVTPLVQRQLEPDEDAQEIQPRAGPAATAATPDPALSEAAAAVSTGGRALSRAERDFFEPRFGRDFGAVRLHDGPRAGAAARGIGARAYTLGRNIGFAPGEHDTASRAGQYLMAHELTHTLQQAAGPITGRIHRIPQPQSGAPSATPVQETPLGKFEQARREMCRRSDTSELLERIDRDQVEIRFFRTATDRWRLADGTLEDEDLSTRLRGNTFTDPVTGRGIIRLNERLSARDMVQTLFHEMQHWVHGQTAGGPRGLESEIQARIATEQMAIDRGWPETSPGYRTADGRVDEAFIRREMRASPHYSPQGRTRVPGGRQYGGETTIPGPFACPPVGDFPMPRRDIGYA